MTSFRRIRVLVVLVSALVLIGRSAAEVRADTVTEFDGSITDVGVQRGPGQVGGVEFRIRGEVSLDQPIDLSTATVILEHLFVDAAPNGLGELMTTIDDAPIVPFELVARDRNRSDNAVFDQPARYRPTIRLQLQIRRGALEFRLKLDRGLMRRRPLACEANTDESDRPFTPITFGMIVDDGVNPPVEVLTTELWECTKPGRYHMRANRSGVASPAPTPHPTGTPSPTVTRSPSRTPTPVPPPASNKAPTASLRSNQLGSGTVELDGSGSSDRDGAVVRYRFDSGDGRIQDGPDAIARFVYPAGSYRAALVVFDDVGAASTATTRGFSVK